MMNKVAMISACNLRYCSTASTNLLPNLSQHISEFRAFVQDPAASLATKSLISRLCYAPFYDAAFRYPAIYTAGGTSKMNMDNLSTIIAIDSTSPIASISACTHDSCLIEVSSFAELALG